MPRTAAERQRQKRARDANGELLLKVRAKREPLVDVLLEAGVLAEWDSENVAAVQAAVERMLALWIGAHVTCDRSEETTALESRDDDSSIGKNDVQ